MVTSISFVVVVFSYPSLSVSHAYSLTILLAVAIQLLNCVWFFVIPWTAAHQASSGFTMSWSLLKLMSIESVMPSNHLILCHPLLLLPSIFSSIRVFFNELGVHIRWPKYWSFSFSLDSLSNKPLAQKHFFQELLFKEQTLRHCHHTTYYLWLPKV